MNFIEWFETFISEKNIDTEKVIEVEGESGTNCIPVGCIIENIKTTCREEQAQIKNILVKIDFANGDVFHFFDHLAKAMAI